MAILDTGDHRQQLEISSKIRNHKSLLFFRRPLSHLENKERDLVACSQRVVLLV